MVATVPFSFLRDAPVLRRNLSLDLTVAAGVGISSALVGSLLPTVARRDGLGPLGLAVLAAAPFIANLLSVLSGRLGPRTPRQLAVLRSVGAASLLLLLVLPGPIVMAAVAILFWSSVAFAIPYQLRVWGASYPRALWGRLIGTIGTGRAAAAGLAALVGGLLADRIGGPQAIALAGAVGAALVIAGAAVRAPESAMAGAYSVRASLRSLTSRPLLSRLAVAQAFSGGGLIAAGPLLPLVQVDRLSLSLSEVGLIALCGAAATTASYVAWGAVIDRWGGHVALRMGSVFAASGLLAYAVAPSAPALWLAAISMGVSGAAIDLGIQRAISDATPLDDRAAAMSGWNAFTGARGVVAPFVGGGLVASGLVDVTGGLMACVAATLVGTVMFLRLGTTSRAVDPRLGMAPA